MNIFNLFFYLKITFLYSASVTAVFKMDSEGTEKRFTRTVQGSSSDYRINDVVCILVRYIYSNWLFK